MTNPFAVSAKGSLTLSVLLHGKPAPNQTVTVIGQIAGTSSAQDLKTDHQGRVRLTVGPADTYLARVKFVQENQPAKGRLEKDSYEATYVFSVFNHL